MCCRPSKSILNGRGFAAGLAPGCSGVFASASGFAGGSSLGFSPGAPVDGRWLEGNIVDMRGDRRVLLRTRIGNATVAGMGGVCDLTDDGTTLNYSFRQYHAMSGGQNKFKIVYDAPSDLFWTVSTVVPDLALTGWGGLVSLDAGVGAGVFSRHRFGSQDFGGPAQIVGTLGVAVTPITHGYVGFRLQHFSDGGLYGADALGVDMYVLEVGYRFDETIKDASSAGYTVPHRVMTHPSLAFRRSQ